MPEDVRTRLGSVRGAAGHYGVFIELDREYSPAAEVTEPARRRAKAAV
jgi:hypothetical protein